MKSSVMLVAVLIGLLCFSASVIQYYDNVNVVAQVLTFEDDDGFETTLVENSINPIVYFFGALFGMVLTVVAAVKFMRSNGGSKDRVDITRLSNNAVSVINIEIAVSVVLGMFISGFIVTGDLMLLVFMVALVAVIIFNLECLGAYIVDDEFEMDLNETEVK